MLGPSGVDLLAAIKAEQARAFPDHPLKLVLLTGYDLEPDIAERCAAIGARYMQKGSTRFSELSEALG
jgi:hypothetical protein